MRHSQRSTFIKSQKHFILQPKRILLLWTYCIHTLFLLALNIFFFSDGVRGQRKDRISSHLSCSECLNLCGPAFILWLTRSVFLTAESGLTFPLWVHRAVLCRDYRVGVGERSRRHCEPTFILMSINQTHSLCFALACDVLQSLYWVTYEVKLHPFVVP